MGERLLKLKDQLGLYYADDDEKCLKPLLISKHLISFIDIQRLTESMASVDFLPSVCQ